MHPNNLLTRVLTPNVLRDWPLPEPDAEGDKETRGRVLVVGGSAEMPGALVLAGTAALRAGAGKLRLATVRSVAAPLAVALPEARVYALHETEDGDIAPRAAERITTLAQSARALVLGPGIRTPEAGAALVRSVLPRLADAATVVLDANALAGLAAAPELLRGLRAILTPHAEEMAGLLGTDKNEIAADPLLAAREAARRFGAVVALKGSETFLVGPDEDAPVYRNRSGNVGLATSGSGDVLAGIIGGLAARGAEPLQAAVWGVSLHARAGDRLAQRMGRLGFLARELLAEIPALMAELGGR